MLRVNQIELCTWTCSCGDANGPGPFGMVPAALSGRRNCWTDNLCCRPNQPYAFRYGGRGMAAILEG